MSKTRYYNPFDSREEYGRPPRNAAVRSSSNISSTDSGRADNSSAAGSSTSHSSDGSTSGRADDSYIAVSEKPGLPEDSAYTESDGAFDEYVPAVSNTASYSGVPLKDVIPDATIEQIDLSASDTPQFTDVSAETAPAAAVRSSRVHTDSESDKHQPGHSRNTQSGRNEQVHKKRSGNPLSFFSNVNLDDLILIGVIVLLFMEEQEKRDMPLIITLAFLLIIELIDDSKLGFLSA